MKNSCGCSWAWAPVGSQTGGHSAKVLGGKESTVRTCPRASPAPGTVALAGPPGCSRGKPLTPLGPGTQMSTGFPLLWTPAPLPWAVGSKGVLKFNSPLQWVKPLRKQTTGLSGVAAGGLPVGYRAISGCYFTLGCLSFWLQLAFFSQAAFWLCVHTTLWLG